MSAQSDSEGARVFYHVTFKSRLESILKHGLLPAKDIAPLGFDQPYPSDDGYVYLFNSARMKRNLERTKASWLEDKALLKVILPASHPTEREYDQASIPLRLSGDALAWFFRERGGLKDAAASAREYVRNYFRKAHGLEFDGEFTVEGVRAYVDERISDRQWAEKDGGYRTPRAISPDCITVIAAWEMSL